MFDGQSQSERRNLILFWPGPCGFLPRVLHMIFWVYSKYIPSKNFDFTFTKRPYRWENASYVPWPSKRFPPNSPWYVSPSILWDREHLDIANESKQWVTIPICKCALSLFHVILKCSYKRRPMDPISVCQKRTDRRSAGPTDPLLNCKDPFPCIFPCRQSPLRLELSFPYV